MNGTIQLIFESFHNYLNNNEGLKIKNRILGKSNIETSSMGMGCWAIGGPFFHRRGNVIAYGKVDDKESIKAIHRGLELGVTLFDTANVYGGGRSERVLGEALKGKRDEVIIATKFGSVWEEVPDNPDIPIKISGRENSPEAIRKACEASLERLQTDYIDIYQLHSSDLEPDVANQVMGTLEDLVQDGMIRYYGWSTDLPDRAEIFARGKHCVNIQFRLNMTYSNSQMLSILDDYNLAGLIKGPLSGGIFSGKYKDNSKVPEEHGLHTVDFSAGRVKDVRDALDSLKSALAKDGRTLVQAALSYIWAQSERVIPIPGFKNIKQVEENAGAMSLEPLSKDILQQIDDIFDSVRIEHGEQKKS